MKKRNLFILVFTLFSIFCLPVWAKSQDIVKIDNKAYQTSIIKDSLSNTTLVPISFAKEALNVPITWSKESKSIKFSANSAEMELTLNSKEAFINKQPITLNAAPRLINGKLYVPLKFLSEALGYKVSIAPKTNVITLIRDEHFLPIPQTSATLTEIIKYYTSQGLCSLSIQKLNYNKEQIILQADLYRIASISKEEYDTLKKLGQITIGHQSYQLEASLSQENDLAVVSAEGTFLLRDDRTFNKKFGLATEPGRYYLEKTTIYSPKYELIAKDIPFILDKNTIIKRYLFPANGLITSNMPIKKLTPEELVASWHSALRGSYYIGNYFSVFFEPTLIQGVPNLREIYMP